MMKEDISRDRGKINMEEGEKGGKREVLVC